MNNLSNFLLFFYDSFLNYSKSESPVCFEKDKPYKLGLEFMHWTSKHIKVVNRKKVGYPKIHCLLFKDLLASLNSYCPAFFKFLFIFLEKVQICRRVNLLCKTIKGQFNSRIDH